MGEHYDGLLSNHVKAVVMAGAVFTAGHEMNYPAPYKDPHGEQEYLARVEELKEYYADMSTGGYAALLQNPDIMQEAEILEKIFDKSGGQNTGRSRT